MKEKKIYISEDGCRFENKEDCRTYEKIVKACEHSIGGHMITNDELLCLNKGSYIYFIGGKYEKEVIDVKHPIYEYYYPGIYRIKSITRLENNNWHIEIFLLGEINTTVDKAQIFITPEVEKKNAELNNDNEFLRKIQLNSYVYKMDDPELKYIAAIDIIRKAQRSRDNK